MKILIAPTLAGKPWNGATIYQESLGGSESAVVYMARGLSRLGHQLSVLTHGQGGMFDGVEYVNQIEFPGLLGTGWDVLIVSRWIELLLQPWKTNYKVLWLHDLPYAGGRVECHRVFCISEFQRKAWNLDEQTVYKTSDGVDTSVFFKNGDRRDPNKLIWCSNPDRGLPMAAKIFQKIRERWPDLELHVFGRAAVYGWGPEVEAVFLPQPQWMENIILHEPVNRMQLAKELRSSWAMFYPTYWPETCCMAALEAQACGTPVITSPIGALPETVEGGIVSHDYLNAVSQLRNRNRWDKLSDAGVQFASLRSWDLLARQWAEYLEAELARRNEGVTVPGA